MTNETASIQVEVTVSTEEGELPPPDVMADLLARALVHDSLDEAGNLSVLSVVEVGEPWVV